MFEKLSPERIGEYTQKKATDPIAAALKELEVGEAIAVSIDAMGDLKAAIKRIGTNHFDLRKHPDGNSVAAIKIAFDTDEKLQAKILSLIEGEPGIAFGALSQRLKPLHKSDIAKCIDTLAGQAMIECAMEIHKFNKRPFFRYWLM